MPRRVAHAARLNLTAAVTAAVLAFAPAGAQETTSPQSFRAFLADVRGEARARGISETTLDLALANLTPEPTVVARDRTQPEQTQSLDAYLSARLTPRVARTARSMLTRHRALLDRVERAYGVPPALMVAIWGLESNFGQFTGTYATVRALATLAYDGRRPLFRAELLDALAILDRGDVPPAALRGSWAGAMGQPQFMPSSFLRYAVDFDADGRLDIWTSLPDVFGSMAHYLRSWGWTPRERWGREVLISGETMTRIEGSVPMRTSGCRALQQMTEPMPLATWAELGATTLSGGPLPDANVPASLVRGRQRHFLVYRNYEALLGYNCSHPYAASVGLLADQTAAR